MFFSLSSKSPRYFVPERIKAMSREIIRLFFNEFGTRPFTIFLAKPSTTTVLPTPAPPKRPIFPPFWYGCKRSIALIPVSKISISVFCSTKVGAGLWMGNLCSDSTGSPLSTGSPKTFKILPKIFSPTGTVIGWQVFFAFIPLFNPSVDDMATALALLSPSSCWTSATILSPLSTLSKGKSAELFDKTDIS